MTATDNAPPPPLEVDAVLQAPPTPARDTLLALRSLIFETAAATEGVGPLAETLKWGEPAYLTEASGSGVTLRLGWKPATPERCAILVNCRTTLIAEYRERFPTLFGYEGERALTVRAGKPLPEAELAECIALALTYHLRRRRRAAT